MQLERISLGKLQVTPIMLSPMAGITNMSYRTLCREYCADGLFVAEMVNARALVEKNPRAIDILRFAPSESIRSAQLYVTSAKDAGDATRIIVSQNLADHIDLNFGCPVRKVTSNGGGSAIPWKRELYTNIIHEVISAAEGKPVTAKFRIGIDDEHITHSDAGVIAADLGVSAMTLHARTAEQYYGGDADWSYIAKLRETLDNAGYTALPLFGNGDIWTADDAQNMLEQTGCNGITIGRGACGRPWIFGDITSVMSGETPLNPSLRQVADVVYKHASLLTDEFATGFHDKMMLERKGQTVSNTSNALKTAAEAHACRNIRKHIAWYFKGYPVGSAARVALTKVPSLQGLRDALDDMLELTGEEVYPSVVANGKRGRTRQARKVYLPEGWLDEK